MRCSNCAAENREGRKFCAECGAPLKARCASCGAENDPAEKFCGECGVALAGKPQAVSAKASATKATAPEIYVMPGQPDASTALDGAAGLRVGIGPVGSRLALSWPDLPWQWLDRIKEAFSLSLMVERQRRRYRRNVHHLHLPIHPLHHPPDRLQWYSCIGIG